MIKPDIHPWNLSPREAIALQKQLARQVKTEGNLTSIRRVAGVDVAINKLTGHGRAAVVVMSYPDLQIIETHTFEAPLTMPYIPGLLSFREIPCLLGALAQVINIPDVILVDGMGIAHPRRLGIASHLGLWVTVPTIGCGKSRLFGTYAEHSLDPEAGSYVPLLDKHEVIGRVVRNRHNTKPLFISIGNGISLEKAYEIMRACTTKYRLPEPIRSADILSKGHTPRSTR
jgi:deoxyribonuclease V